MFLVTSRMADSVANRTWPQPVDSPQKATCANSARPHEPAIGQKDAGSRCNYGAEIENLDRLFGIVLDKVRALGELDNTLVCVSSDHGEMHTPHKASVEASWNRIVQP